MSLPSRSPAPLSDLLTATGSTLKTLVERAGALHRLQQAVNKRLPEDLRAHCRVANVRDQTLILQADTSTWATRLRCLIPELLAGIKSQSGMTTLRDIRIKVSVPQHNDETASPQRPSLSDHSVKLLTHVAETADPELRAAWLRLAGRL